MTLSAQKIRQLKAAAHHLKPIVMIGGKGLSDSVVEEVDRALTTHELIKIKFSAEHKAQRGELVDQLCQRLTADFVGGIGRVLILFRPKPNDK